MPLAPHGREIVGADRPPAAILQARADRGDGHSQRALRSGRRGARRCDAVIAIFFLRHLPGAALAEWPGKLWECPSPAESSIRLTPAGTGFRAWWGARYQTAGERELEGAATAGLFRRAGFEVRTEVYGFGSSPLAGLLPDGGLATAWRALDNALLRLPTLRRHGSIFELD